MAVSEAVGTSEGVLEEEVPADSVVIITEEAALVVAAPEMAASEVAHHAAVHAEVLAAVGLEVDLAGEEVAGDDA